ncbi:Major facilitator super domain-containing protein 1 [Homalodisca vitripennis]|nr:Major facilitator super domain-containing protein 1 [Homalodisca vitripennis]
MGLSTAEFTLLYAVYAWPNVLLCFIGGFLIDRVFGIQFGTILYAFIVVIGQLIFAAGAYSDSFGLMLVGRFVFGIGGESLAVAQNNYAVVWFMGKELNTVFGLQLSFARVGSTVNLVVLGPLYNWVEQFYHGHTCLGVTLFIATATCIMSLLAALLLGLLRKKKDTSARDNPNNEVARITDVKDFNVTFWLICVICVVYYVAIFPLIALGKVFFERKFDMTENDASWANSILYITSAAFSPVSGYLVDKTGRNVFWVSISIFFTIIGHAMLAFTLVSPYFTMAGKDVLTIDCENFKTHKDRPTAIQKPWRRDDTKSFLLEEKNILTSSSMAPYVQPIADMAVEHGEVNCQKILISQHRFQSPQ